MAGALSIPIGVTSTPVIPLNINRKGLIIVNASAAVISLAVNGEAAVLNGGVTLFPGGTFSMGPEDFTVAPVLAIASAAGSLLSVQEFP